MKKLFNYIITGFILTLFSCSDNFLEETPYTFLSPQTTYKTEAGIAAGAVGLYDIVAQRFNNDSYFWSVHAYENMSTDITLAGMGINPNKQFARLDASYNASTGRLNTVWRFYYQIATNAATIISRAEALEWDNDALKKQTLSEAYFFRAYAHFYLTMMWGDVPMIEEEINGVKLDFVRNTQSDVLSLVKSDLLKAEENVEYENYENQDGRINKGIVQHFLSYVYLADKDYANAEKYAGILINSGKYALMTERFGTKSDIAEGNVFWDLFQNGNQNASESANKEGIWIWQNGDDEEIPAFNRAARWPRSIVAGYYKYSGLSIGEFYGGRGVGIVGPTEYFLDTYEPNDTRGQYPNWQTFFVINSTSSSKYGDTVMIWNQPGNYDRSDLRLRPYPLKWSWDGDISDWSETSRDFYMSRLSETYLILAEAQFMQGGKVGDAVNNINIIRRRAGASEISAGDLDIDFILEERARELYGEISRRVDLVRTGKYIERTRNYNEQCGENVEDKHALLPIPQSQIVLNTEAELTQNTGWE